MSDFDGESLSAAWLAWHHAAKGSSAKDEHFWAFETMADLCHDDPETCFELIEKIRKADGSDWILANLAAGPLEDLLSQHGARFIDRIETLARQDPQMRRLLGGIWRSDIPDAIWHRVQCAAGPSF